MQPVSIAYRHLPLSGLTAHPGEVLPPLVSIAYRHLPLSGPRYGLQRDHDQPVSIAYRHLPLSGLEICAGVGGFGLGLHCLSALTPFGTELLEETNARLRQSPLPIGTYPFRDLPKESWARSRRKSPLPIGTCPFRDQDY